MGAGMIERVSRYRTALGFSPAYSGDSNYVGAAKKELCG